MHVAFFTIAHKHFKHVLFFVILLLNGPFVSLNFTDWAYSYFLYLLEFWNLFHSLSWNSFVRAY